MKQIRKWDYLSPQTIVYGLVCEGVLCESVKDEYDGSTTQGYSSGDELFEIF